MQQPASIPTAPAPAQPIQQAEQAPAPAQTAPKLVEPRLKRAAIQKPKAVNNNQQLAAQPASKKPTVAKPRKLAKHHHPISEHIKTQEIKQLVTPNSTVTVFFPVVASPIPVTNEAVNTTVEKEAEVVLYGEIEQPQQVEDEIAIIKPPRKKHVKKHAGPVDIVVTSTFKPEADDRIDQAKKMSERVVLKEETNLIEAQQLLQSAYQALQMGQIETAQDLYEQVHRLDPSNVNAALALAVLYQKEDALQEARDLYNDILSNSPDQTTALYNFLVLLGRENPDKAIDEFNKLQQIRPKDSVIPAQIAMIYAEQKQYPIATKYLRRALSIAPSNTSYMYNLALLLERQGETRQAEQIYMQLVDAYRRGESLPIAVTKINARLGRIIAAKSQ